MKDCKFKSLIKDIYKDMNNRTFTKEEFGMKSIYKNYFGFLYNCCSSTDSLDNIKDINKYMDIANPDMLLLHSRKYKNQEIEIYSWDLKDYKIENDILYIYFNNGKEKEFKL